MNGKWITNELRMNGKLRENMDISEEALYVENRSNLLKIKFLSHLIKIEA